MSAVINKLVDRLRDQAKRFNPSIETAPVAVLWTDDKRDWEGVLPQLKAALPELFSLGDYLPDERTGPGVWLRMVADKKAGDVQPGQIPIFYLPGVANSSLRTDLRAVKDDTQLAPIAELQYRGNFWRQDNGKDWTLRAFFESKRTGLGIATKGDQHTLTALKQALPRLLTRSLATLEGRNLDLTFLDEIINPNPADDVLRWIADPLSVQVEKGESWPSFVASSKQRYDIDLNLSNLDGAATVLQARESDPAYVLWEKFAIRPEEQAAVYQVFKAVRRPDLLPNADRYPADNEADETALQEELNALTALDLNSAATKILELESQHGSRRNTVWAQMGKAPLASALLHLSTIAKAALQPASGGSVSHQAKAWADEGWLVDAAAIKALEIALVTDCLAAIEPPLLALYRPWLQRSAETFQQRVASEGYPSKIIDEVTDGTVLLFVDGLRLDLAKNLEATLSTTGLTVDFQHRFTSVPSVTSSGKVWCSPGYAAAQMSSTAKGFEPTLRLSGSDGDYTAERLRRAIQAEGFQIVDPDAPDIASGRGWAEFIDDIDSDGHKKGVRLAEEAPRHVAKLARTVERLLSAGWQKVRVVTDHGWILMPGGLQKVELHSKLAETKWARCAVVKDSAVGIETITMPWSYGPEVCIALAPGIGAFKSGQVYDHGGLTLQECVVPMLDIVAQPEAQGRASIKAVHWNTRKTICKLETEFAEGATFIVERLGNVVGEAGIVDAQGNAQVVFDEVDDLIDEFVLAVLRRDGMKISELQIKFGEVWNATR
jgi:hypothetical protein